MTKATIDDVSALAGVSIKTVSRVVNNEPNVRSSTRERVLAAIKQLNYSPNPSARSLAARRSFLIGLVYDDPSLYEDPSSSYIINIQQGVLRTCKAANYDLLIHPCNYRDKDLNREVTSLISHSQLDGIILAPPLSDIRSLITAIRKTGTPVVRISPGAQTDRGSAVYTNDRSICAQMTEYLAGLGHRRIAFITGHPDHRALEKRYLGYQDGLKKSGLKLIKALVKSGDNSFASGERCARQLLTGKQPPTAIFACNDDMAAGVVRAAHKLGIKVPEDLSVAGFDDIALAKMMYPTLTTIRQPVVALAESAAELLISQIRSQDGSAAPRIVDAVLKLRESTGPAKRGTGATRAAVAG